MPTTKSTSEKPDPRPEVLKAIQGLRDGYKVGLILLKKGILGSQSEGTGITALAAKHGYYPEAGRKLRKFARLYTAKDVDDLCKLCRKHQSAFGVSQVYLLLPIGNRRDRLAFQQTAVINRWGNTRLRHELRRRFGREPAKRGRKPQRPRDATDAVLQLFQMSFRFVRWHRHNMQPAEPEAKEAVRLPKSVQDALNVAAEAMANLHAATAKALKRAR
jgi:hypothetical protein